MKIHPFLTIRFHPLVFSQDRRGKILILFSVVSHLVKNENILKCRDDPQSKFFLRFESIV